MEIVDLSIFDDLPDVPFVPGAPQAPEAPQAPNDQDLPLQFCVKTRVGGRDGYFLLRWSHGGLDADNKIIHVLKPSNHQNRFYNIGSRTRPTTQYPIISRKQNGQITRPLRWIYTSKYLRYEESRIPILMIIPFNTLPSMKVNSFIPIREPVPLAPVPLAPVPVPVAPVLRNYIMNSIPQHIVRALLRDAAMQEESCPITSEEIDITNGAITSCFHLFEKNAIAKWLSLPNSLDKCPVCNCPCNSYTLDEPPPLDTA